MLAEAIEMNFESPDTMFFWIPFHGLNNKGPSIIYSVGFSFNFFKALIIDPESPKGLTVKTMIEFHKKNWETMFVSAEKAFSLNAGDPNVLSFLAVNVAFGGECTLNDVTSQDEQTKNINKKKCQFHRGCWDMGLKAHELDTGNVVIMDNY